MRFIIHLCLLSLAAAELNNYLPPSSDYNYPFAHFGTTQPKKHTDFYTYSAPNEYEESTAPVQLASLLRPQQVVFIRTPEKNIFTQTAEQLSQINPLEIYVLSRQTNVASLAQQYREIRQRHEQKPSVHFVKYRTPQDVSRALTTLRHSYDEQHPGSSINHREALAQVLNFSHGAERLEAASVPQSVSKSISPAQTYLPINAAIPIQESTPTPTPSPVIFKIRPHGATDYETHIEAAKAEALLRQYLPSGLL